MHSPTAGIEPLGQIVVSPDRKYRSGNVCRVATVADVAARLEGETGGGKQFYALAGVLNAMAAASAQRLIA
jgi:hypothetical protein